MGLSRRTPTAVRDADRLRLGWQQRTLDSRESRQDCRETPDEVEEGVGRCFVCSLLAWRGVVQRGNEA